MIVLDTHIWIWWVPDQIIVATPRILDAEIVSTDNKILSYSHVRHAAP